MMVGCQIKYTVPCAAANMENPAIAGFAFLTGRSTVPALRRLFRSRPLSAVLRAAFHAILGRLPEIWRVQFWSEADANLSSDSASTS
jgi:hypothetical protein